MVPTWFPALAAVDSQRGAAAEIERRCATPLAGAPRLGGVSPFGAMIAARLVLYAALRVFAEVTTRLGTLRFGDGIPAPKATAGQESNWIETVPGRGFYLMFRFYGPTVPLFDGTWALPAAERI